MKGSVRTKLSILFVFSLVLILSALLWVTNTSQGLRWVFENSRTYIPGDITIKTMEGSLLRPINIKGLSYQLNDMLIKAENISVIWNISALFAATIDINQLHISDLHINFPPAKPGDAKQGDNAIQLPDIHLPWHLIFNDARIKNLVINNGKDEFKLKEIKLEASALFNQVDIKTLHIASDDFSLNANGEIRPVKNYPHKLDIHWRTTLASAKVITGQGYLQGNMQLIKLQQHISGPVQMTLNAQINDVLNNINWQASAQASDINPGLIWPEWPGNLKATLKSNGNIQHDQLFADIQIEQLSGMLREYPVTLDGQLHWQNNGLDIRHANFNSGKSKITADGRIDSSFALNWDISSTDLAELYPQAKGQLNAKGKLSGSTTTPLVNATFHGQDITLPGYEFGKLDGEIFTDISDWKKTRLRLATQAVNFQDTKIKSVNLISDSKRLEADIITDDTRLSLEAIGDFHDNDWQGQIVKFDINSTMYDNWRLKSPAKLKVTAEAKNSNSINLQTICLVNQHTQKTLQNNSSKNSHACANLQYVNNLWHTDIEFSQLPLNLFKVWLPPDLKFEGIADASAKLMFQAPDKLQGTVSIKLPAGHLSYPVLNDEYENWIYRNGNIDITLNQQGLKAVSELAMTNGDHFRAHLSMPGFHSLSFNPQQQTIIANAEISVHDLGFIETIVPEVRELKGDLKLTFSAEGTAAEPKLYGKAILQNGSFSIPRLGLNINEINLKSHTDDQQKFNFILNGKSADGQIEIKGHTLLDKNSHWSTLFTIEGDSFEIANTPEAKVLASPKLNVSIRQRTIKIDGDLHIPYAKLQPKDISTAAHVSDDVVIIGQQQAPEEKWLIHTRVRLTLGDRVSFYGFGFEGRLAGNLLLEDEPGQLTKATGEVTIPEGRYRAYGQRLEIEQGRLIFTGGPVTNPGLDLNAVRTIGDIIAGVKARGSLKKPEVEIYSIPAMGQTDVLSYLLLGRPMESTSTEEGEMMSKAVLALSLSSGDYLARNIGDKFGLDEMRIENTDGSDQASLIIGRYLSPKLYVSYGVGLIDAVNTTSLRYQLSNKWQIKGTSGEEQSADLLYTIER